LGSVGPQRRSERGHRSGPIAKFDLVNNIGLDLGLQHSFTDTTVKNGFEYWYTLTAYDRGDASVESLESPKGNTPDALNTVAVVPVSDAANRTPVSAGQVGHSRGKSTYVLDVQTVVRIPSAAAPMPSALIISSRPPAAPCAPASSR
jgi:hypothetical protein